MCLNTEWEYENSDNRSVPFSFRGLDRWGLDFDFNLVCDRVVLVANVDPGWEDDLLVTRPDFTDGGIVPIVWVAQDSWIRTSGREGRDFCHARHFGPCQGTLSDPIS